MSALILRSAQCVAAEDFAETKLIDIEDGAAGCSKMLKYNNCATCKNRDHRLNLNLCS